MTAIGGPDRPAGPGATGGVAVRAESLHRFFHSGDEETLALRGVSLEVAAGELVAVTGPSGSGKSTLLACLAGLDEPDGGTVTILGERLSHRPEPDRARRRALHIGVLHQRSNLVAHLTVAQNVRLVRRLTGRRTPGAVTAVLDSVGLGARAHALPAHLSGGEAARAGLAVALANAPAVLLADEPTGELDSATEQDVLDRLRAVAAAGTAVLVASHAPAVRETARRVIRLSDGRVAA